jgi:hypothetical protein
MESQSIDRKKKLIYRSSFEEMYSIQNLEEDEIFLVDNGFLYQYEIYHDVEDVTHTFLFENDNCYHTETKYHTEIPTKTIKREIWGKEYRKKFSTKLIGLLFIADSNIASSLIKPIQLSIF